MSLILRWLRRVLRIGPARVHPTDQAVTTVAPHDEPVTTVTPYDEPVTVVVWERAEHAVSEGDGVRFRCRFISDGETVAPDDVRFSYFAPPGMPQVTLEGADIQTVGGSYYVDLDTMDHPGDWFGYVWSTGDYATASPFYLSVAEANVEIP